MVEVLIIVYSMIMWVVFKVFKVPVNKWTGTTAVLGGVISIGFMLLMMGIYHPFTKEARIYTLTTPVLPTVKGRVTEVNVKTGDRVKAGDLLFRIDPEPFQYAVDQLVADLALANSNLSDATELFEKKFASAKDVERVQAEVDSLTAQLGNARFSLAEADVRAESDGYVAQVRLRPGVLAVPMPFSPLITFVHEDDRFLLAGFQQNPLQNIKPDFEAEVIFTALPGKVFAASVVGMSDVMAQGQLLPDGRLISLDRVTPAGRVLVRINIDDDLSEYQLPAGVKAYVAVYSDTWKPIAAVRKMVLRIMSWENYLFSIIS
ncbi:MAG: biotin/lipoyl-binding protein [Xanthomonadales bacterium]|nr:biotin/lipoyl-binding protein [Xanthomonadales bacterium]MDH4018804.1 biotin/lipoyl-binding protein [Xanthomonadales bacterium]